MILSIISVTAMAVLLIVLAIGFIAFAKMIYQTFKDLNKWE